MEKKNRNKRYLERIGDNVYMLSVSLSVEKISFYQWWYFIISDFDYDYYVSLIF